MDIDEPGWPLIDDFFRRLAEDRKPPTQRRYARVRHRLYDFLDTDDMIAWLGPDDATLLAAEREFVRDGAVWGVFGVEGVLRCLPGLLSEAALPPTAAEARMQISVIGRLVKHFGRLRLLDQSMSASYRRVMVAMSTARLTIAIREADEGSTLEKALIEIRDSPSLQ